MTIFNLGSICGSLLFGWAGGLTGWPGQPYVQLTPTGTGRCSLPTTTASGAPSESSVAMEETYCRLSSFKKIQWEPSVSIYLFIQTL